MKLATISLSQDSRPQASYLAFVQDDRVSFGQSADWPESVQQLIESGQDPAQYLDGCTIHCDLEQVRLHAPIPRPNKNLYCIGFNYRSHIGEVRGSDQGKVPEHPVVFSKVPDCVCGPFDPVPDSARLTSKLDWEVELAVIIRRRAAAVPQAQALDHVFGYTVINDLSARDLQARHQQFLLGKSLPCSAPMGPWVVTADEIPNPQGLRLSSRLNGELMQQAHTSEQIFQVAYLIETLSAVVPLVAGDIIATGTPSGVGAGRNPPVFLRAGDKIACEIEGIGGICNPIVASTC